MARLAVAVCVVAANTAAAKNTGPSLGWPIECQLDQNCFIQNYVDRDPDAGAPDFACGHLTYDGHKGTDIALPDLAALRKGIRVLAVAPGRVRSVRDGLSDLPYTGPGQAAAVRTQECGNGVVISHEDGWESQYCHLRKGSVAVKQGQMVAAGAELGLVGLSGKTEFPHLHLELRRQSRVVDPFDSAPSASACGGSGQALWQTAIAYRPTGLIAMGFAPQTPDRTAAERGEYAAPNLPSSAPVLSLWVRVFGARKGDRLALKLLAPDGTVVVESPGIALPGNRAQYFQFAGGSVVRSLPEGRYRGEFRLTRGDEIVLRAQRDIEIR